MGKEVTVEQVQGGFIIEWEEEGGVIWRGGQ